MSTKDSVNVTLRILGLSGLSGVSVEAANATQGLKSILKKAKKSSVDHKRVLAELKRQGLVHITKDGENYSFTVTPAGAYRLQNIMVNDIKIKMPARWDKKWRLVTFDIPVLYSKQRVAFTRKLRELNFVMIQKSMWVHPSPCFEQIEELAGHYNIMRYCSLMEITKLDELTTKKLLKHYSSPIV